MSQVNDEIRRLEEEVRFLREERRKAVDSLEMAASLGRFDRSLGENLNSGFILKETATKLKTLIRFKALSFYLVDESDNSFYRAYCDPGDYSQFFHQEVSQLIDNHTFAWILNRTGPVILPCMNRKENFLLRSLSSPSRIRGMFVGILDQEKMSIPDTSYSLVSIVLLSSASALESIETYNHMRKLNQELENYAQHTERLYQDVFENAPVGIFWTSPDGRFLKVNPCCARITGFESPQEMMQEFHDMGEKLYLNLSDRENHLTLLGKHGHVQNSEILLKRRDGRPFWALISIRAVRNQDSQVVYHDGFLLDITERKQAEEEKEKLQAHLLHVHKLESVGTLAGGIAHDFNNLLQAMGGNIELVLQDKSEDNPDVERLKIVAQSIDRAAQLVKQLLLFSRKAKTQRKMVDLNQEVKRAVLVLERTIPRMVEIKLDLDRNLRMIKADPVQVEQVLLNLGSNASCAMPDGGRLVIKTENISLDQKFVKNHMEAKTTEYVLLTVSDTGTGMDKETVKHIFDPFFTTKEVGKGTGLGLASVYGTVKNHKGHIVCSSKPGKGTTFKIYWPVAIKGIDDSTDESGSSLSGGN